METESGLTRATTLIALTCFLVVGAAVTSFLVVGAAVTSILGGDGVPAARLEAASAAVQNPVANRESKQDRRAPATMAMAAYEPPQAVAALSEPPQTVATLSEPLRQAYASASPADIEMPSMIAAPASVPHAPTKPKVASKPPVQKSTLLSDGQIAGIKGAPETFLVARILLAGSGKRAARGGHKITPPARPIPTRPNANVPDAEYSS